ncbi:MAG TPA: ATP-binding protein [Xanthomonadales bacterium]|nr:ATP-binding protein [Xanthomonadales bacterium]
MQRPAQIAGEPETDTALSAEALTRRERYFFDFYRVLEAVALAALCVSPAGDRIVTLVSPLAARAGAFFYLGGALALFAFGRLQRGDARGLVLLGLLLDVLAAITAIVTISGFDQQIAALLLVNVSCGALLLPLRTVVLFIAIACIAVVGAFGLGTGTVEGWSQGILFSLAYASVASLCQLLRSHVAETRLLAERREIDLATLTNLNDLIIRRMRTGVIVVDAANTIHRINESAWQLLGNPSPTITDLGQIAPDLSRRLYHWRSVRKSDSMPVSLAAGMPEVIPRFAELQQGDERNVLIFLDDISVLSRRAEQLTLSSLGRLSASVAHEVRNPLAAISYSAQLLSESEGISEPDQRLIDIIRSQCTRMNAIVENILQLSRRERSRPEQIDLARWVVAFVDEYRATQQLEQHEVRALAAPGEKLPVLIDPNQLHQVTWNLVQNAVRYGRLPHESARVTVSARRLGDESILLEVSDRGPGIPPKVAAQVFEPFFTTHEHGTGLGLYIARQLCEANQATLEYVSVAGGGSCFRISIRQPRSRMQSHAAGERDESHARTIPANRH